MPVFIKSKARFIWFWVEAILFSVVFIFQINMVLVYTKVHWHIEFLSYPLNTTK